MTDSPVQATVDLSISGKRFGMLLVPDSRNDAAWANAVVPLGVVVGDRPGPSVLVLAGNHGDEYEGQIAALRLLHEVRPEDVSGRIVVLPCLSTAASKAGTRLWPTGENLNRSFPGSHEGSPAEVLADYLVRAAFPHFDVVFDIHSGGRSLHFAPMTVMHYVPDVDRRRANLDTMLAWGADFHMSLTTIGHGFLAVEVDRLGKHFVTTELGGGGVLSVRVLELAHRGLRCVLHHLGVLVSTVGVADADSTEAVAIGNGPAANEEPLNRRRTRLLRADVNAYTYAPFSGLYEPMVEPGENILKGAPVGSLYSVERPELGPFEVPAASSGVVAAVRAIAPTAQGDVVALVAREVSSRDELLAELSSC